MSSGSLFENIIDQANALIGVADDDGKLVVWNETAGKVTGYPAETVLGSNGIWERIYPDKRYRDRVLSRMLRLIKSGNLASGIETRIVCADGREKVIFWNTNRFIDDDGKSRGTVLVGFDITRRARENERLKKSLSQNSVILKEIQHRIKNNLQLVSSLLNLQSSYVTNDKYSGMLEESQNRIQSIAILYEQLYESKDLSSVRFSDYVRNLIDHLLESYCSSSGRVTVGISMEEILLGTDKAVPCGLIINELVSNSLKYAFPRNRSGRISIEMSEADGDSWKLSVSDDGVGFPGNLDFRNTKTLGLQLVCILTDQLEGTIELDRNCGTRFTIRFSKK